LHICINFFECGLDFLQAEDFAKKAHEMLDWLTETERHLRYQGPVADNEDGLQQQLTEHEV
jgi:hypothetical protein